jgi:hypothetical protein
MPLYKFKREYEKSWETFEGMPVYPNFRDDIHIARTVLEPHIGLPLLLGVDFGLSPAVIVGQLQGNSLKLFREFTTKNEGVQTFIPKVVSQLRILYPEWGLSQMHWYIDPAGFQRAQTDAKTCAQEMYDCARVINIEPGPVDIESRRSSVEHFLLYIDKDGAGLELNESLCPMIAAGFRGGYRYADKTIDIEPNKIVPTKDAHSHPHDGLQYMAWGARNMATDHGILNIPIPSYGFTESKDTTPRSNDYGRRKVSVHKIG